MNKRQMGIGTRRGYEWGRAHGITDTQYAGGNSASFNEGVRMAAREQLRQASGAASAPEGVRPRE